MKWVVTEWFHDESIFDKLFEEELVLEDQNLKMKENNYYYSNNYLINYKILFIWVVFLLFDI